MHAAHAWEGRRAGTRRSSASLRSASTPAAASLVPQKVVTQEVRTEPGRMHASSRPKPEDMSAAPVATPAVPAAASAALCHHGRLLRLQHRGAPVSHRRRPMHAASRTPQPLQALSPTGGTSTRAFATCRHSHLVLSPF
jgi:hypothetical protein